jgi:hypothetical protein
MASEGRPHGFLRFAVEQALFRHSSHPGGIFQVSLLENYVCSFLIEILALTFGFGVTFVRFSN